MADRLPACFLEDLIHAQMSTGNFGKMASAAISWAQSKGDKDAAQLYRNLLSQVSDYYASLDDGTIRISLRPSE